MTEPRTRHAVPADHSAMARTLAEAFAADPVMAWLFPGPDERADPVGLTAFMEAEVGGYQNHGHAYVVDDRAVALWAPPGAEVDQGPVAEVMAAHAHPERMETSSEGFIHMYEYHPTEPYFYLSMIGSRDDSRGQGLGTILLRRVLEVCDREGHHAHLESSNIRNVGLYERHGFEVLTEIEFASGVIVRPMTRRPR